jgi:hypothetical protein
MILFIFSFHCENRVDDDGKELLVAVSFSLRAREAVAAGRARNQRKRWEAYALLFKKVPTILLHIL